MAITGAAAIAGAVAAGAGVSATVIAVAGLAITAVGMITKNSTLMKIGGGIGLGAGAAGLASAATSSTADAAAQGIAAPSVADAAGAGSQAAGDVAETTLNNAVPGLEGVSYGGAGAADASGLVSGAAQTSTDAAITGAGGLGGDGTVAPVDASLNGAASNSIDANLASTSPAQSSVQSDLAASNVNANAANVNPANANAANVNPANANTIAQNTTAASPVAPGTQAPTAAGAGGTATTGSGAPYAFDSSSAYTPVQNGLQAPSSWWQDASQWFTNPKNNGIMQLGGGLIKGVGQGVGAMIQASGATKMTDQQKWEQQNMSGAGSVPTVNMAPSGAPSPYASPQTIQQRAATAVQTTTPAYQGIINKQRS